jgi:hypothetical protein
MSENKPDSDRLDWPNPVRMRELIEQQHEALLSLTEPMPERIDPDTLLRLDTIVRIRFPDGSATVNTLRNEIKKGKLPRHEFGGKLWLTLNEINQAMMRNTGCAQSPGGGKRDRGSSSNHRADPAASGVGSSTTATLADTDAGARRAAMELIASRLRASGPTRSSSSRRTSPLSRDPSKVVPIR